MNRIFKVVFNHVLGRHVVVSEVASSIQRGACKAVAVALTAGAALAATSGNALADAYNAGGGSATGTNAVAIGPDTSAQGVLSTVVGQSSSVSNPGTTYPYRGATATIYGVGNTVGAASKPYDGVANSVIGVANSTNNANAALLWGAGNKVTNAYGDVSGSEALQAAAAAYKAEPTDANLKKLQAALAGEVATSGGNVMAIGGANTADYAQYSEVIGVGNELKGKNDSTKVLDTYLNGHNNKAYNTQNVTVIGSDNTVGKASSTYIQKDTIVIGDGNKIGTGTTKSTLDNVVIGNKHTVNANNNVIIGSVAEEQTTNVSNVVSLGYGASVTGASGTAIGVNASAKSVSATVVGAGSSVGTGSDNSLAYGANNAITSAKDSLTLGSKNTITNGDQNIVLGSGQTLAGTSTASGNQAKYNVVLGAWDKTDKDEEGNTVAVTHAQKLQETIMVGHNADAQGNNAVAVGSEAVAKANAVSVGNKASAGGSYAVAVGDSTDAANTGAVAVGRSAKAQGNYASALGYNSTVTAANGAALGYNTTVDKAGGVALGSSSKATTDKGIVGYDQSNVDHSRDTTGVWKSTLGAVSVGGNGQTRQITNVAAGTEDSDAVNVAQLKSAKTHYFAVNSTLKTEGSNYDGDGAVGSNAIAVGAKAKALPEVAAKAAPAVNAADSKVDSVSVAAGEPATKGSTTTTDYTVSVTSKEQSVVNGKIVTEEVTKEGTFTVTDTNTKYEIATTAGEGSTVNTYTVTDNDGNTTGTVTDTNTKYEIATTAGEGSTVNTYTVTDNDGNTTGTVTDTDTKYEIATTAGEGSTVNTYTVTDNDGNTTGTVVDTNTTYTIATTEGDTKGGTGTVNTYTVTDSDGTTVGKLVDTDTRNKVVAGNNITVTQSGDDTQGPVTYTINGKDTVVAAGENVTVDSATDDKGVTTYTINAAAGGGIAEIAFNGDNKDKPIDSPKVLNVEGGADQASLTDGNIGVVSDGDSTLAVKLAKDIKDVDSITVNKSVTVGNTKIEDNKVTVGDTVVDNSSVTTKTINATDVKATNVTATNVTATTVKAGNTTINNNGMTIQNGPTITQNNVDMGGQTIHNVGPAQSGGDAVNYSQLKQTEANFDQKLNHLNGRIGEVAQDANAGIAMALAAASLPQAYLPGKSMMSIAGGTYRGEQGYAIGFSTVTDNGKWVIKANASGNSQGHYGAAIGAGYMW